jgi:uncharacterized membrane protein
MKTKIMRPRVLGVICLLLIAARPTAAEKRWAIKNVEINAHVDSAGYLLVEEKRAYQFWGKFSYAYYDLALAGLLDVDQMQVLENGEPYQLSDEKTPGTFLIERGDEKIHIRWQFRDETRPRHASGDIREFTLRFRVLGAVRVHRDVAELYYKFVGTGWDRVSEKARVTLQLPKEIRQEELRAWAHGPLHGNIAILPNNLVELSIDYLSRQQLWEARVVFPAHYISAAAQALRDDRDALPEILSQETRWAEEANRQRAEAAAHRQWQEANRAQYFSWLWLGMVLGIAFFLYMYQRYGRSLRNSQTRMTAEPPTEMPPAVANYTWNAHQLNGGALLATLFDLASRDYLRWQHQKTASKKNWFSSTKQEVTIFFDEEKLRLGASTLLPYERQLLEFLQRDLAQNRRQLSLEEIQKHSAKFHRFFRQWKKSVALQAGKPRLYDPLWVRASAITLVVWLMIAAANIFAVHAMGETATPFAIVALGLAPSAFFILRYEAETAQKLDRLKSFRDYLKRFQQNYQKYGADWQQIDKFLVYAVALGLTGAQMKPLMEMVERERGSNVFPWFIYHNGHAATGVSLAMISMVDLAATAMSSASGAGGGAAAGGGGGAGGSGGGAG